MSEHREEQRYYFNTTTITLTWNTHKGRILNISQNGIAFQLDTPDIVISSNEPMKIQVANPDTHNTFTYIISTLWQFQDSFGGKIINTPKDHKQTTQTLISFASEELLWIQSILASFKSPLVLS